MSESIKQALQAPSGDALMASPKPEPPANGARITIQSGKLSVPDHPTLPFIEGDGTGPAIWRASVRVLDAAVKKAYGGKREIQWMEVYAGEKAYKHFSTWLPDETVTAFRDYLVGIKGPLVSRRSVTRQAPRTGGHGHLPGEHGRCLRRHRVRGRQCRREEDCRFPQ